MVELHSDHQDGGGLEPPLKDLEGNTGRDVQRWGKQEKR